MLNRYNNADRLSKDFFLSYFEAKLICKTFFVFTCAGSSLSHPGSLSSSWSDLTKKNVDNEWETRKFEHLYLISSEHKKGEKVNKRMKFHCHFFFKLVVAKNVFPLLRLLLMNVSIDTWGTAKENSFPSVCSQLFFYEMKNLTFVDTTFKNSLYSKWF